jgi:hypothetical protein
VQLLSSLTAAAAAAAVLLRPCVQDWLEVPFKSRRNIMISMVLGTGTVWFWNKSEQPSSRQAGRQQVHQAGTASMHAHALAGSRRAALTTMC